MKTELVPAEAQQVETLHFDWDCTMIWQNRMLTIRF